MIRLNSKTHTKNILTSIIAILLFSMQTHALVVVDGQNNNIPPTDDPGWANVGSLNSGTGIYLGNQWAITASHIYHTNISPGESAGPFVLNGTPYNSTIGQVITNTDNTQADLRLIHLDQDPGLPLLNIRKTDINTLDQVTIISQGVIAGSNYTSDNYTGYYWSTIREKLWGENTIGGITNINNPMNIGDIYTHAFTTMFDENPYFNDFEAQAADKDSGGAAFTKNDQQQWELAGVILSVIPTDYAIFNLSLTHTANLVHYRHDIMAAINIPGDINRDNSVSLLDLDILGKNFGLPTNMVWEDGDLNGDKTVSLLDLDILGANFGQSAMTTKPYTAQSLDFSPYQNTVPEPAAITILAIASTLAIARRQSNK